MGGNDWVFGVFCGVIGAVTLNFGTNLMKRSHLMNAQLVKEKRKFYLKQPQWITGFVVFVLGNVFDFLALSFAAQSIVAPLGACSIISNIFFASCVLGESLRARDALGTVFVVLGAVFAVTFGDHADREYTMDEIRDLLKNPVMWVYWPLIFTVAIVLALSVPVIKRRMTGGLDGRTSSFFQRHIRLYPLIHIFIGGIIGAQTIIGAKILSELLKSLAEKSISPFGQPGFYLVLFVTASTAVIQIHQFQLALRIADALFVVPAFFCVWTIFSIVGGGLFFHEFSQLSPISFFLFFCGVFCTFGGVMLLSKRLKMDDVMNDMGQLDRGSPLETEAINAAHVHVIVDDTYGSGSALPAGTSIGAFAGAGTAIGTATDIKDRGAHREKERSVENLKLLDTAGTAAAAGDARNPEHSDSSHEDDGGGLPMQ